LLVSSPLNKYKLTAPFPLNPPRCLDWRFNFSRAVWRCSRACHRVVASRHSEGDNRSRHHLTTTTCAGWETPVRLLSGPNITHLGGDSGE
jgi:hypothetical protein